MEEKVYGTLQKLKTELSVDWSEVSAKEDITYLRYLNNLKTEYDQVYEDLVKEVNRTVVNISTEEGRAEYERFTYWRDQNNLINDFLILEIEKEKIRLEMSRLYTLKPESSEDAAEPYQKETGKRNIPYKLALLREEGILDNLNVKYDNNKEQLYRILDFLTGGNSKNYYLSMYGDDYNGKDKITRAHTAYLRKNGLI